MASGKSQNRALQILLSRLAAAACSLTDEEVDAVVRGRARIKLSVEMRAHKASARTVVGSDAESMIQVASERLRRLSTREAGLDYLRAQFRNRSELFQLARALDIPADNHDPRSKLEERIVEATIGFRLRSDAIQNRSEND